MKKFAKPRAKYRNTTDKSKDNVICYVALEVVLCR